MKYRIYRYEESVQFDHAYLKKKILYIYIYIQITIYIYIYIYGDFLKFLKSEINHKFLVALSQVLNTVEETGQVVFIFT